MESAPRIEPIEEPSRTGERHVWPGVLHLGAGRSQGVRGGGQHLVHLAIHFCVGIIEPEADPVVAEFGVAGCRQLQAPGDGVRGVGPGQDAEEQVKVLGAAG